MTTRTRRAVRLPFELLWVALGEPDTLLGVEAGILAIVHEVAALGLRHGARLRIALLEVEEVADILLRPRDFRSEDTGLVPRLLPLVEIARKGVVEQTRGLAWRNRYLTSRGYSSSPAGASSARPCTASGQVRA
jgi:hypothetical protein